MDKSVSKREFLENTSLTQNQWIHLYGFNPALSATFDIEPLTVFFIRADLDQVVPMEIILRGKRLEDLNDSNQEEPIGPPIIFEMDQSLIAFSFQWVTTFPIPNGNPVEYYWIYLEGVAEEVPVSAGILFYSAFEKRKFVAHNQDDFSCRAWFNLTKTEMQYGGVKRCY